MIFRIMLLFFFSLYSCIKDKPNNKNYVLSLINSRNRPQLLVLKINNLKTNEIDTVVISSDFFASGKKNEKLLLNSEIIPFEDEDYKSLQNYGQIHSNNNIMNDLSDLGNNEFINKYFLNDTSISRIFLNFSIVNEKYKNYIVYLLSNRGYIFYLDHHSRDIVLYKTINN
jgi:hypothetical protein